jgi:hypothetical protein
MRWADTLDLTLESTDELARYNVPAMRRTLALFLLLLPLLLAPAHAVLPNPPKEDIHFLAEHVPESVQDARYLFLPWPAFRLEAGTWQGTLAPGYVDSGAGFLKIRGPMLAGNAVYGFSDRWGIQILAFYDQAKISGGSGTKVLHPLLRGLPLDVPENAEFSNPRGDYTHWGVGALLLHEVPRGGDRRVTFAFGLLADRLEIKNYQLDYRLLSGANAGAQGVLDHSSSATYATPIVGVQYSLPLGSRFALAPRFVAGAPFPKADFDARLTGPGFDLSTARGDGQSGQIGDAFVGLSTGLIHLRSGLEVDLGSTLFYPLFEKLSHPGIDRAYTVQVGWHWR